MKQINLLVFSLAMAMFIFSANTIQAQKNSSLNEISAKENEAVLINPNFNLIPGGYRVEVENNPLFNKSQSALEVIKSIPGVFMQDSILEVTGKKDLLLQVNGFDIRMSALLIPDYLTTILAENIKEIEVIQNPSAIYNSFNGCVINIITRKPLQKGTYGNARAASGNFNKFVAGGNLYLTNSKSDFSLSVADNYNKTFNAVECTSFPYYSNQTYTNKNPKLVFNSPSAN